MTSKKSEPNPIEEAIGDRAMVTTGAEPILKTQVEPTLEPNSQSKILDEPSPTEMLTLEELNHRTTERLQDQYPEENNPPTPPLVYPPDPLQQEAKNCSLESQPPQKIDETSKQAFDITKNVTKSNAENTSAEDVELTALKKYILDDGFVLATVSFHIVSLCAQPMTTPSTTNWDYKDRAMVPEMVFSLLNKCGYLEGIWPSLKIIMADNKGNAAWCSGVATTIAFFDTVRMLPVLKELKELNNDN